MAESREGAGHMARFSAYKNKGRDMEVIIYKLIKLRHYDYDLPGAGG